MTTPAKVQHLGMGNNSNRKSEITDFAWTKAAAKSDGGMSLG